MGAGQLIIRFVGDTREFDRTASSLGGRLSGVGKMLTKTITPAAAAAALVFKEAGEQWKAGVTALRVGTGQTGAELEKLKDSAKAVVGETETAFDRVAASMSELATRTGQTGKPLEDLTKRFVELEEITGEAAEGTIPAITRLFGDWSVATEDQAGTMDKLFRASQKTGVGVQELSELMVQFGSPLRQLGLDFDFTAAMFARFEKEGVNIQTAMPGLRMALKNFAKDGREPAEALMESIEAIKNAASTAEANTLAFEIFGTRAGPDLAAAIREGRFDLESYIKTIRDGKDSIASAADDTDTLADRFANLKNRVMATIGPIGEVGAVIAGGVASVGPFAWGLGGVASAFKGMGSLLTPGGVLLGGLGLLALAFMDIGKRAEHTRRMIRRVADGLKEGNPEIEALVEFVRDDLNPALERSRGLLAKFGGTMFSVQSTSGITRAAMEKFADTAMAGVKLAREELIDYRDHIAKLPAEVDKSRLAAATAAIEQGNFALATELLTVAERKATTAIQRRVDKTIGVTREAERAAAATKRQEKAERDLIASINASNRPIDDKITQLGELFAARRKASGDVDIRVKTVGLIEAIGQLRTLNQEATGASVTVTGTRGHATPGLAHGGTVTRSGLALVGEKGPELLRLPTGAQVRPLSKEGSGPMQITGTLDTPFGPAEVRGEAIRANNEVVRRARRRRMVWRRI